MGFGMDCTSKAIRNMLTPLRSLFEDALNDEPIDFNPSSASLYPSSFDKRQRPATMW
ncbi:hypothetical protein P353_18055 [Comamonas testosteroni]|uniref:Uncharacterized protein n=1 Tax=Comamonas testosteroni TaxID=285 RepID=A0A096GQV7_COMTE|nr:hypothetical protein P353_18055 [Comamonas testosteroni]